MFENQVFTWLLLDTLVPLLGASILFLLWGGLRYIANDDKGKFTYGWSQSLDSLGWLYGGAIIAVQSSVTGYEANGANIQFWLVLFSSAVCWLTLIAAMGYRGEKTGWKPPTSLRVFSLILVSSIIWTSYDIRDSILIASGVVG